MDPRAVVVRRGYKSYGNTPVLADLNMAVSKGSIYGLLGASGCGKTTLLSCVVGRRRLDSGQVTVLGVAPGTSGSGVPGRRVGYMPQEISLYSNLTMKENVFFFGKLFDMNNKELEERLKFLVQLFELPDSNTKLNNLSGGQQRRVSLVVAMVHDPDLLVLDEPTVGMDPMLRLTIWEYLMEISRARGKTIIITTHYIEEARQADTVGLMRNGYLLEETSPLDLLDKYGCESLEEVFLLLSTRQDEKLDSSSINAHEEERSSGSYELEKLGQNEIHTPEDGACRGSRKKCIFSEVSTAKIVALLHKNVLTIGRDTMLLLFFFGQNLLAVASFYMAFGFNPSDLAMAVVNHDATSPSRTCQGPRALGGCNFTDLSCLFLDHIGGPVFRKEFYDSPEEAQRAVGLGKAWGAVYLGENFTQAFEERIQGGIRVADDAVEQGSIFTWLDMSDDVISWAVRDELYTKYQDFSHQFLGSCGVNPKYGDLPMKIFKPVFGKSEVDCLYAIVPGLLLFLAFLLGVSLSVWTVVHERVHGLLARSMISGVTTFEIMLSYFLCMFVMICMQAGLIVVFAFLLFHYYNVGSLALISLFLIAQGTCGLLYGFVISACCNNEGEAIHLATGSLYPSLFLCGIIWPVEGMNRYLYYLSMVMPLTLPIRALRWIMVRGWTLRNTEVLVGFLTMFCWMAVFLVACMVVFRFKKL
ncbi:ABC transporter G family member 20-like isoform X2 [Bacillus rossius redtenbacheri]|uniref:ABC transporter G family member 20-like isoform X2 n=1 Tax=Bacillus rossius redtenbacheri TaxID=93214 RepID=UPI002FDC9272